MSPPPPPPHNADDDDLDDLDDVLEQFHPAKSASPAPPKPAPPPPAPGPALATSSEKQKQPGPPPPPPPVPGDSLSEDALSDEFAARFAAEMEKMMRQLGGGEDGAGVDAGPSSATPAPPPAAGENDEDAFQRTIRQAMEKLQESDDTLKADSKGGEDTLEGLLASLGDLGVGGEGEEGLEGMMETIMAQLMSKEILYEPLKELDTKYPEYLTQNAATLPPADLTRFTEQKSRVTQLVALFETPGYSDDDATQAAEVLRLMNEMQSYGSPPTEIMGAMPPGFDIGADGMPGVPEGCIIS